MVSSEKSGLHLVRKVMACLVGRWKLGSEVGEKGHIIEDLNLGVFCREEIIEAVRLYEASEEGTEIKEQRSKDRFSVK